MARVEVEVLDMCAVHYANLRKLGPDDFLTVATTFISTIRDCRRGDPLDAEGRLVLSTMVMEAASYLNTPAPIPREVVGNVTYVHGAKPKRRKLRQ